MHDDDVGIITAVIAMEYYSRDLIIRETVTMLFTELLQIRWLHDDDVGIITAVLAMEYYSRDLIIIEMVAMLFTELLQIR